jgi:hypothetical protein
LKGNAGPSGPEVISTQVQGGENSLLEALGNHGKEQPWKRKTRKDSPVTTEDMAVSSV